MDFGIDIRWLVAANKDKRHGESSRAWSILMSALKRQTKETKDAFSSVGRQPKFKFHRN